MGKMFLACVALASALVAGSVSVLSLEEASFAEASADVRSLLQLRVSRVQSQLQSEATPWWKAYGQDAASAAKKLVEVMTWEEKKRLITGWNYSWDMYAPRTGFYAGTILDVPRLQIPSTNMQDGGNGFRTFENRMVGSVTSWPSGMAVISAWEPDLVEKYAKGVSQEFYGKGANLVLGPGLDLSRVGRGGRNPEGFVGEDPYVGGVNAPRYVRGFQSQGVAVGLKHWILNTQETNRRGQNNNAGERARWEMHYPAWEAAIKAGAASVMCAYNGVNGVEACINSEILEHDLKGVLGFKGFVMTDWWAIDKRMAASAAKNGLDVLMPGNTPYPDSAVWSDSDLKAAGDKKVNDKVERFLYGMISSTAFDRQVCTTSGPGFNQGCQTDIYNNVATQEHEKMALEFAEASVVLLKNEDGLLPLGRSVRVALLGSACNAKQNQTPADFRWNEGDYYTVGGSGRVVSPLTKTIYEGLNAKGVVKKTDFSDSVDQAMDVLRAGGIDVAIACGGVISGEAEDRANLKLDQHDYLVNLAQRNAQGPKIPLVVVTMSTGSILTDFANNSRAVVSTFMAGQATAEAVANILLGDTNPSGHLVVTFPAKANDLPDVCTPLECDLTEGLFVGYRNLYGKPVAFPFGHGLAYTTFEYEWGSKPAVRTGRVSMQVRITNTGKRPGREVAQLYMSFPEVAGEPDWVLRGYQKTGELAPGNSETVEFVLDERATSIWNDCDYCSAKTCYGSDCYTCQERIDWLVSAQNYSSADAREQICVKEFPRECGLCYPATGPSAPKLEYLGCYKDVVEDRDLPVRKGNGDIAACEKSCKGYKYFGRQWEQECWCGNSYGKYGKTDGCQCSAANIGGSKNCVYSLTEGTTQTTTTTGSPSPTCHAWMVVAGEYEVFVGGSSRDERLKGKFQIHP